MSGLKLTQSILTKGLIVESGLAIPTYHDIPREDISLIHFTEHCAGSEELFETHVH